MKEQTNMKKIMTWFAAAAFAAFGFSAFADLQDDINNAVDKAMVKMTADYLNPRGVTNGVKTVTIDMDGHEISGDVKTEDGGKLIFKNGVLSYGSKFTGPGVVLEEGVRCKAYQQRSYVGSDMKMTPKKIDGVTWYVVVKEENDPIIVAERFSYYEGQGEDRMQYKDLATAFGNVMDDKTIQTVRLVRDVKENVTVKKTVIFDMDGKQLDGSITAQNTGTARTNWLQNVNMTGKLTAQGDLRIIMQGGTNTYNGSFEGDNIRLEENTVFGYKQAKKYLADDMAMAKVEANRWQVVNTNRLEAAIGKLTDLYQTRQAFLSAEDAARLAGPGEVDEFKPIHFLANRSDNIKLNQAEINKGLYFDPTNKNLGVSFTGVLEKADGVFGDYTMATTKDGYVFLTKTENIVAEIVESGKKFITVAAAFAVAENGQQINMVRQSVEGPVTQDGKTNFLSCARGDLAAELATINHGRIEVLDGTESYADAFAAGSDLKLCVGSKYGFKQSDDFLPEPHEEYAYARIGMAPDRWEVVPTNDVAVEIVRGGVVVDCFKTPEAAIEMAEKGDTIRFRKAWGPDETWGPNVFVDVDGLAKELKFDPGRGKFEQQPMRIWSDGYRLVQDGGRLFTLKPLYDYVAVVAKGDPDYEMLCETFLDAMDYAVLVADELGYYPEIKFLEDFPGEEFRLEGVAPDNIVVPEEYFEDELEFNPDGHEFPGKLIGDEDHFMAINARDNYVLATEDEIVAVVDPHERGFFTDAAAAVRAAADEATVTIVKDTDVNVKAVSDITFQTAEGIVYRGLLDADGHSVETKLGNMFGKNLINEFDWSNNGLTLKYDLGKGVYVVVPAEDIVAEVRHVTDPVKRFTSVQDAFDWLRAYVDANSAEAINFYGIDVIKAGDYALDLGGKNLNWPLNMESDDATVTVGNGVIAGNFTLAKGTKTGTLVLAQRVRMLDPQTAFQGGSARLVVKAGAYVNDPTPFCEPGYTAARRAKTGSELDGCYVIYPCDEAEVTVTDADGHHIHYKTIQDAFDLEAGGTIQLFNNGPVNATLPAGKRFTLTSDPNGAGRIEGGARKITGGELTVYGDLTISDVDCTGFRIVTWKNKGANVTIGDNVTMSNAVGGAIWMAAGNKLYVDTQGAYIYDNKTVVGGNEMQYNVILENDEILVLKQPLYTGKIGVSLLNVWPFQSFAGRPFGRAESFYSDGDIFFPEQRFVNDYDPTMSSGKGTGLEQKPGFNYMRWVGGYDHVLTEGIWLLSRTGDKLVWLEIPAAPADTLDDLDQEKDELFVGRTAYTITIRPVLSDAYGRDYAIIESGTAPAVTNWVSMTGTRVGVDSLAWNADDRTFTFEALKKDTVYTLVARRSISTKNTVSDVHVCGEARTAKYDALEIAKMFYDNVGENFPKMLNLAENAGNAGFVTVTTAGPAGNGYVVTLQRDLNRGADLKDDMGRILLQMNGQWLNAKGTDEGITFTAAADYNENLPTDLTIVNNTLGRPGRIVGAIGADGNADDANGHDGRIGIHNTSANLVGVAIFGGVEVYGGQGGKGADRTDGAAGQGGKGGDAIVGNIALEIDGAQLVAGNGGDAGKSTNGTGGNGGNGGAGVGEGVTVNMKSGGVYGGNGGNAGGGVTAGDGGDGGDGFVDVNRAVLTGGHFFTDPAVEPGKGGFGGGADGKGGRPQMPEKATVRYVTGDSVTLNVEPDCEYFIFRTDDGEPADQGDALWIATGDKQIELYVTADCQGNPLVKGTRYTVWARKAKVDGELVSVYSTNDFWTRGYDALTIEAAFKGKAEVAETAAHDGYVITLTDDIDETVEIPDNWGKLALEMGSFSIRGRDGVPDTAFGAQDAIVFTAAGDRPELTTTLTINGDGANEIKGGDGAKHSNALASENGFDGGNGGFGLGVRVGWYGVPVKHIFVTLVKGTLRGGNGGDGADTVDGRAGNGGIGGDAYDAGNITVVIEDPQVSGGEGGGVFGGNGGKGGNVYGGVAGNGGDGGSAIGGEGGWAGRGGQTLDQTGTAGTDGNGGAGVIPGSVSADYLAKLVHMTGDEDFYESFEEAIAAAIENDRLVVIRGNKKMPDGSIDYKTCVFDGDDYAETGKGSVHGLCEEVVVGANNIRITTDNLRGIALEWNGTVRVDSGVTGFVIDRNCNISADSTGELILDGAARIDGGFIPDLKVYFEGRALVTGGTIGEVSVEQGGKFTVELESDAVVTGAITCDDRKDVLLFGGLYEKDPSQFRRDPFKVLLPGEVDGKHFKVVQDPKFAAMASTDGGFTWTGVETVDEAFAEIKAAQGPILVYLLKDETTVTTVLSDQATTDAVIMGPAHKRRTIIDGRTGLKSEIALFNLQGNLTLRNVTFDGRGQTGKFIELMGSKTVTLDNCKVTGYACQELNAMHSKIQLISASSAGQGTALVLNDTELTGNDVSCAISTEDRSGSGFTYPVYVSGRTTITGNVGKGIVSTGYGQVVMAGPLTGGWIDVAYDGYGARQYFATTVASSVYAGVENFRYDGNNPLVEKTCGAFAHDATTGNLELDAKGRILIKWGEDERQWAAKVTYAGGAYQLFETVEEALQNVENGAVLKLENDATVKRSVTVRLDDSNESFTLDLNGKRLTNSANKLKFGTGIVTIENGTLACESAYALYLYGATVELRNVTVDHDIYVARGFLQVKDNANVRVRGVIAKTNIGTISLASGLYTENPSPYTASNRAAAQVAVGFYTWAVVPATEVVGFADGFVIDTTPDADGKVAINLTNHEAFGNLRDGAKIVFTGDVRENVTVTVPAGWKVEKIFDWTTGKTVVTLRMDNAFLMPVLGSDDPGERPLEFVTWAGGVVHVTMRVKNGVKGFWYQLMAKADLNPATPWVPVAEVQATENGNLTIELNTSKDRFFKVNVSDRSYKGR